MNGIMSGWSNLLRPAVRVRDARRKSFKLVDQSRTAVGITRVSVFDAELLKTQVWYQHEFIGRRRVRSYAMAPKCRLTWEEFAAHNTTPQAVLTPY